MPHRVATYIKLAIGLSLVAVLAGFILWLVHSASVPISWPEAIGLMFAICMSGLFTYMRYR